MQSESVTDVTFPESNQAFLLEIFCEGMPVWTCSFRGDPRDDDNWQKTKGGRRPWSFLPLPKLHARDEFASNTNYCPSVFIETDWANGHGTAKTRRRKDEYWQATYAIIVDDADPATISEILEPTYVIETSPSNYQVGYALSVPMERKTAAKSLVVGINKQYGDPNKGITSSFRLPYGVNTKYDADGTPRPRPRDCDEDGQGFQVRQTSWSGTRYTAEQIAAAFGIDIASNVIDFRRGRRPDYVSNDGRGNENVTDNDRFVLTAETAREQLGFIDCAEITREEWLSVAMVLEAELGEDGFEIFEEWSKTDSDRYDDKDCRDVWNSCDASNADNPKTGGWLRIFAKEHGWVSAWDRREAAKEEIGLVCTKNGEIIKEVQNIIKLLKSEYVRETCSLVYDEFYQSLMVRWRSDSIHQQHGEYRRFEDPDYTSIECYLGNEFAYNPEFNKIKRATVLVSQQTHTNAFRDWLEALPPWNGRDNIQELAELVSDDRAHDYCGLYWRKTLVAAVNRAFDPDCQVKIVPALMSNQSMGKSTFLRWLAPKKEWASDNFDVGSLQNDKGVREFIRKSHGLVFCELAELKGFTPQLMGAFKAFTGGTGTRDTDKFDKHTKHFKRVGILVATANGDEVINDDDNTRIMPIPFRNEMIDLDAVDQMRDQVWAQALALYQKGERPFVDDELRAALKETNAAHRNWYGAQEHIVEMIEDNNKIFDRDVVTVAKLQKVLSDAGYPRTPRNKITEVMEFHGWVKAVKPDGKQWTFKVTAADCDPDTMRAVYFGKEYENGQTVGIPVSLVRKEALGEKDDMSWSDLARQVVKMLDTAEPVYF